MRLQLDAKAMEYLFNNSDEEWKLQLQTSVVQAFASRYLKSLVHAEGFKVVVSDIKNYIDAAERCLREEIANSLGKVRRDYNGLVLDGLSSETKEEIKTIVFEQRKVAVAQLLDQVTPGIVTEDIKRVLTDEYKKQIRESIRQEVIAEIKTKLI